MVKTHNSFRLDPTGHHCCGNNGEHILHEKHEQRVWHREMRMEITVHFSVYGQVI